MVGNLLAGYRIIAELGSGAMGAVYFGEHERIGRRSAIKILHPSVATSEEVVWRFFSEARAVNNIRHPNIVDITDFGEVDGHYYLIMELLEGETLGERLERGRCDEEMTIHLGCQIASALVAAHEHGIVHRDLKPENIFLTNHPDYPNYVKLLDFGIAKLVGHEPDQSHRTKEGTLIGTPAYMSPEQCMGANNLDHRSDIYSLGIVLYEMLTNKLPFADGPIGQVLVSRIQDDPIPVRHYRPELSPRLTEVLRRCLERAPDARYADMQIVRRVLRGLPEQEPEAEQDAEPEAEDAAAEQDDSPKVIVGRDITAPQAATAATALLSPAAVAAAAEASLDEQPQIGPLVRQLSRIILDRIAQNKLVLPAMPAAVMECMRELRKENVSFTELADIIGQDPIIAPQIVARANAATFGATTVRNLDHAISRLGMAQLRLELVSLSAFRVFTSRNRKIQRAFEGMCEHSVVVAGLARDLAMAADKPDLSEDAYLSGLLHDVGKPIVGAILLEAEKMMGRRRGPKWLTAEDWIAAVEHTHRAVGVAVAAKWGLSDSIGHVVENSNTYNFEAPRTCLNFVCLGNAMAKQAGFFPGGDPDEPGLTQHIAAGQELMDLKTDMLDVLMMVANPSEVATG